jgi:putative ABC transport system permease protein
MDSFLVNIEKTRKQSNFGGESNFDFSNINCENIEKITKNSVVTSYNISRNREFDEKANKLVGIYPDLQSGEYSRHCLIKASKPVLEAAKIHLETGDIPQNSNEIIVPRWFVKQRGKSFNVGDTVKLIKKDESLEKIGEVEYKIVGILSKKGGYIYDLLGYLDENKVHSSEQFNIRICVKDSSDDSKEKIKKLEKDLNQPHTMSSNFRDPLGDAIIRSIIVSVVGIILLTSVLLIYNSFSISVSERSQDIGIISSIGATNNQKISLVLFEAIFMSLLAIPMGLTIGVLGVWGLLGTINSIVRGYSFQDVDLIISPLTFLNAILMSLFTIFISCIMPILKFSKFTYINLIRQNHNIKLSKRNVKTSWIIQKIFGFEGTLALKNLKRNKRKYFTILVSLVTSLFLFIVFSGFLNFLEKSMSIASPDEICDLNVTPQKVDVATSEEATIKDVVADLKSLDAVKDTFVRRSLFLELDESVLKESFKKSVDRFSLSTKHSYYISLQCFDDEVFEEYLKNIGLSPSDFNDTTKIKGIFLNKFREVENEKIIEGEIYNIGVGKKVNAKHKLYSDTGEINGEASFEIEVGCFPSRGLFNSSAIADKQNPEVIVSKKVFEKILNDINIKGRSNKLGGILDLKIFATLHDKYKTNEDLLYEFDEEMSQMGSLVQHQNNLINALKSGNAVLISKLVFYAFTALISLISATNVFNTISTSVSLRKREFAGLKSVGMTNKSFNKMIYYESFFYGMKTLIYGLSLSFVVLKLIHELLSKKFEFPFSLDILSIAIGISSVFLLILLSMIYASSKIKKENIIDILRNDNI